MGTSPSDEGRGPCRHRGSAPTTPAVGRPDTAGGVQREHVEEDGVARLELPADHGILLGVLGDRWQLGEGAIREPPGGPVEERAWQVPRSAMRPDDELQRRLPVDGVDREPHRDVEPSVDVVVRKILVPWGALGRAWFLDEDVVVVQAHRVAAHQLGSDLGGRCFEHEPAQRLDSLPVAEVLDERPVVGGARPLGVRREIGQIGVDRLARQIDEAGVEGVANAHRAVPPVVAEDLALNHDRRSSGSVRRARQRPGGRARSRRRRGGSRPSPDRW